VFVEYGATSLLDVPIGLMFLATALGVVRALATRARDGLLDALVCGAFFVGLKVSLIAFLPVFGAALLLVLLRARSPRRAIAAVLAAFVVLSSPWYVKNFVEDGDPVPPLLNLAVRGADAKWSKTDLGHVQNDLRSHEGGPVERARIPVDIVFHTQDFQFRAPGVSFMMFALVVPGAVVAYLVIGRRGRVPLLVFGTLVVFAISYWIGTSYMARYSLEFLAGMTAFCAGVLALAAQRGPAWRWGAVACAAFLAIPSPGAGQFYADQRSANDDFTNNFVDRASWMPGRGPLYPEVLYVSDLFHRAHRDDLRVYRPNVETDRLYWVQHGITPIGDLVGKDRYEGFDRAIYDDTMGDYVREFAIGAFIIPVDNPNMPPPLQRRFDEEMRDLRFTRVMLPGRPVAIYLAPEVAPGSAPR
jgi:hypothetical protein